MTWNDMFWWCDACQTYHPAGKDCYGREKRPESRSAAQYPLLWATDLSGRPLDR